MWEVNLNKIQVLMYYDWTETKKIENLFSLWRLKMKAKVCSRVKHSMLAQFWKPSSDSLQTHTHHRRLIRKRKCLLKKGQRQSLRQNYLLYMDRTEITIHTFSILYTSNDLLYESLMYVCLSKYYKKSNQVSNIKYN